MEYTRAEDAYAALLREEGFLVEESVDCREAATSFLGEISVKLKAARLAVDRGRLQVPAGLLEQAEHLVGVARDLV